MSIKPGDLATVDYIDGSQRVLLAAIEKLEEKVVALAARPADDYLSINQLMQLTDSSRKTVENWIKVGKRGPNGQVVKLPTYQFGEHVRVKRADLEAFGQIKAEVGQENPRPTPPPSRRPKATTRPDGGPLMRVA